MNKLGMPDDDMAEKGMSREQRQERQEKLAMWARGGEVEETDPYIVGETKK